MHSSRHRRAAASFISRLDLLDLDEMSGIERKRRVVAVAFVRAEAAIGDFFAAGIHLRGIPELLKVPVVVAQIADAVQDLAARNRAFVVDDGAGGSGPALQLRPAFQRGLRDQFVHVDVDCGFEESGVAGVVVLDRGMPRIFADRCASLSYRALSMISSFGRPTVDGCN